MNIIEQYAKAITEEYNKWVEAYDKAIEDGYKEPDMSIAAFMCDRIRAELMRSSRQEVKDYFEVHAK